MVGILVERRGRCREAGLVVGLVLGQGGTANRAVQEEADDDAPKQDADEEGAEDGANGDEDGSIRRTRVLHEGRILGRRHGWGRICRDVSIGFCQRREASRA